MGVTLRNQSTRSHLRRFPWFGPGCLQVIYFMTSGTRRINCAFTVHFIWWYLSIYFHDLWGGSGRMLRNKILHLNTSYNWISLEEAPLEGILQFFFFPQSHRTLVEQLIWKAWLCHNLSCLTCWVLDSFGVGDVWKLTGMVWICCCHLHLK